MAKAEISEIAILPNVMPMAMTSELNIIVERSEEHTSELQSPVPISYAVFCLKKKKNL